MPGRAGAEAGGYILSVFWGVFFRRVFRWSSGAFCCVILAEICGFGEALGTLFVTF